MGVEGFRIVKAKDDNGKIVRRWMIDETPRPFTENLRCFFCSRRVVAVGKHPKGRTIVSAYFRLHSGEQHAPECELYPTRVVEEIARGSGGLASVRPGGTLRLAFPDQAPGADQEDDEVDSAPREGEEKTALRIKTVPPLLPPALNSAVKIVRFLQQCDFDEDVARRFTVEFRRKSIPWAEFCYGPGDDSYAQLHQRINGLGKHQRLMQPVAVHGTVIRTGRAGKSGTGKPYAVLAVNVPPAEDEENDRDINVVLRSAYPRLLADLKPGMHVLALGIGWKIFHQTKGARPIDEVQLWLDEHWNLAYWTWDEKTEKASPAKCPSAPTPAERRAVQAERASAPRPSPAKRSGEKKPPPPLRSRAARPKPAVTRRRPSVERAPETRRPDEAARRTQQQREPAPGPKPPTTDLVRDTLTAYSNRTTHPTANAAETPEPSMPAAPSPTPPIPPVAVPAVSEQAETVEDRLQEEVPQVLVPPRPDYPPRTAPVPPPPQLATEEQQPAARAEKKSGIHRLLGRWRRR